MYDILLCRKLELRFVSIGSLELSYEMEFVSELTRSVAVLSCMAILSPMRTTRVMEVKCLVKALFVLSQKLDIVAAFPCESAKVLSLLKPSWAPIARRRVDSDQSF